MSPPSGRRRPLLIVLTLMLALYGALLAGLFVGQRSLLYFPDPRPPSLAAAGMVGIMEEVRLRTEDGLSIVAWMRRPPADMPTLVYFHGNGGHIEYVARKLRPYADAGLGLMLVEYRGYSGNPGSPTEQGLYADARAALDYLKAQSIPPKRIVLFGESLGTGVAVRMASERPVAALILESPGTSIAAVAQSHYWYVPARWLVLDRFDSASVIDRVNTPLLVLHGTRDTVIPVAFGQALFDAAKEPKELRLFPDARHVDLHDYGAAEVVLDFLHRHVEMPEMR